VGSIGASSGENTGNGEVLLRLGVLEVHPLELVPIDCQGDELFHLFIDEPFCASGGY
jgi:hypothetical protein